MLTCYPALYRKMVECGTTCKELAAILGVSKFTLYAKMLGLKRWKLTEVLRICCFFRTQDAERMFRKRFVHFCSSTL